MNTILVYYSNIYYSYLLCLCTYTIHFIFHLLCFILDDYAMLSNVFYSILVYYTKLTISYGVFLCTMPRLLFLIVYSCSLCHANAFILEVLLCTVPCQHIYFQILLCTMPCQMAYVFNSSLNILLFFF